jgi:hypothetical protein
MSWIAFLLGLVLVLAGGAGLVASIDLATTELGLVYATCGAIAVSGGVITIAIGLLIRRVDALRGALSHEREEEPRAMERAEPIVPPLLAGIEPVVLPDLEAPHAAEAPPPVAVAVEPEPAAPSPSALEGAGEPEPAPEVAPVNENRKGHLPGLDDLEQAITPTAVKPAGPAPSLIGRYSAGGADYSIFSDGSIEAQTSQGEFKFASMREFKEFISTKKS